MNLTVVSSHKGGRDVADRQYYSCLCEIGCALLWVVPGTRLRQIGQTLNRYGWTALGADQRVFAKGRVKAELWDEAPGASAAAADTGLDLKIMMALPRSHSPRARPLRFDNMSTERAFIGNSRNWPSAPPRRRWSSRRWQSH
jgi:hypothetical protein